MSNGLDIVSAKRIAFSHKKYWRLLVNPEIHWVITTKRFYQWGLVPLNQLVESAHEKY